MRRVTQLYGVDKLLGGGGGLREGSERGLQLTSSAGHLFQYYDATRGRGFIIRHEKDNVIIYVPMFIHSICILIQPFTFLLTVNNCQGS